MPLKIVRDDLVNMRADAVVLPSNENLIVEGGAGEVVARKAGLFRVRRACHKLGGCAVGAAVATSAFSFPAKHLIHAVGPVWSGSDEDARLLRCAYDASLQLALSLGCASIAMPLLSAGSFGCPAHVSLSVALGAVESFFDEAGDAAAEVSVTLVLFDRKAVLAGLDFLGEIEAHIDDSYAESHGDFGTAPIDEAFEGRVALAPVGMPTMAPTAPRAPRRRPVRKLKPLAESSADANTVLEQRFDAMDEGFSRTLLQLIDQSGMTDAQVYRRANISRQHFSKIRSNVGYRPSKVTVISLCVALELDIEQARDLLERAGFALSHANKFDIIMEYFIERGIFDQIKINETLFYFDQPLLGG